MRISRRLIVSTGAAKCLPEAFLIIKEEEVPLKGSSRMYMMRKCPEISAEKTMLFRIAVYATPLGLVLDLGMFGRAFDQPDFARD